ncbi:hypothetical protein BKA64DRAFT_677284 [Cadophora sp. MPI-SDFR-AT-0126]|nr:hypothetical protein BKA64DRAFT_677284 [Leotiomycetes sp. MPI-SDFR-AT-0126]
MVWAPFCLPTCLLHFSCCVACLSRGPFAQQTASKPATQMRCSSQSTPCLSPANDRRGTRLFSACRGQRSVDQDGRLLGHQGPTARECR